MSGVAGLANAAWLLSGTGAVLQYRRALEEPGTAQWSWLAGRIARDRESDLGRAHGFGGVTDYASFEKRVPLCGWEDLVPQVERIRAGEAGVLGLEPVTHLVPTSGSSGARKLIPFTASLKRSFSRAVAPWLLDLVRQRPGVLGGPAYWSISPLEGDGEPDSAVPVGFPDDAEYLGSVRAGFVRRVLPVPSAVRSVPDVGLFRRLTLLALLRCRSLRMISVWHPSFLELLLEAAVPDWDDLLEAVADGANPWSAALPPDEARLWRARPDPSRAAELRRATAEDWTRWWPDLQVVSCWGEQAAEPGWRRLADRCPDVLVQRKGLLATEGVVTIPIGRERPLAVTSHFFEFIDASGGIRLAHQLEKGGRYEVVLTNGAGLWRYRLGDLVECTGHLYATPSLRFLGRAGGVSDLRGEKLSEWFVAEAMSVLRASGLWSGEAQLHAWEEGHKAGYILVVETPTADEDLPEAADRLEDALIQNPHYALARRLGQLEPLRVRRVRPGSLGRAQLEGAARRGQRLGDVKPTVLVAAADRGPP
ncbi:MAG: GH3 auxin-responsive promoter family protein [Gemmatimonadales bacterium]|nr:MAG: GH3 auxin-responsive promoter family protein [Gemmatimonadales bacterium]